MLRITIISLFFVSFNLFAGELENLALFHNDLAKYLSENNATYSMDNNEGPGPIPPATIPAKLEFIYAHQDLKNFKIPPFAINKIAVEILSLDTIDFYDQSYQEAQEVCLLLDESEIKNLSKCEKLLEVYDQVNEELMIILDEKKQNSLGIQPDKEEFSIDPSGPNRKIENQKESFINTNINEILCKYYQTSQDKEVKLAKQVLVKLVTSLEKALLDPTIALADRKNIYCALMFHYEDYNLFDRLTDFLYLNMPEGENFCERPQ